MCTSLFLQYHVYKERESDNNRINDNGLQQSLNNILKFIMLCTKDPIRMHIG